MNNTLEKYISIETNIKLAEKLFDKFMVSPEKEKFNIIKKVIELCEVDPEYNYYYLKYCLEYNNRNVTQN